MNGWYFLGIGVALAVGNFAYQFFGPYEWDVAIGAQLLPSVGAVRGLDRMVAQVMNEIGHYLAPRVALALGLVLMSAIWFGGF